MKHVSKAFTIVELVIVIATIAILASISIVAYSGVQERARDAKRVTDVKLIADAYTIYASSGKNGYTSGAGVFGYGFGVFEETNSARNYTNYSIKKLLTDEKLIDSSVREPKYTLPVSGQNGRDYALLFCTDDIAGDKRRLVAAQLEKPPSKPLTQQITELGCTNGVVNGAYADAASDGGSRYNINYAILAG